MDNSFFAYFNLYDIKSEPINLGWFGDSTVEDLRPYVLNHIQAHENTPNAPKIGNLEATWTKRGADLADLIRYD